jgi:putative MATE family efflux protein
LADDLANKAEIRQRMITEGSLHKAFLTLAAPAIAAMSMEFILHFTDMIWVGKIGGPVPVAIVTSSMFSLWIVWSVISTLTIGTVAMVSRFFGAKEFDQASHVASQAITISIVAAVFVSIVGILGAPLAFRIMGTSPEVTQGGIVYLRIQLAGSLMWIATETFSSIFRASGDTKTPMIVSLIAIGTNLILDPFLIFGIGPFPRLGTTGAAIASVIAFTVGVTSAIIFIKRGKLPLKLNVSYMKKPNLKLAWRIVKIGIPLSISGVLFSLIYFFINRIAAHFGNAAVAAMGIGNRCESISFLLCFGASMATSTLVGQNLGAGKPERAAKAAWVSLFYAGIFTMTLTILFVAFPGLITRLFLNDPAVEPHAINYLIIIGLSQIFMASEIVMEGAFSGAGDTLPPMLIGATWTIFRIPIAYILCFPLDMGVSGIWWAISSTTVIKGIAIAIWFRRGKWKSKKV